MFHESLTATLDLAVLLSEQEAGRPRVSAAATYRSGTPGNESRGTAGRLPGCPPASPERAGSRWRAGTPIFMVSRQQFIKHPG